MRRKIFSLMAVFVAFNLFFPWDSSADVTNLSAYPVFLKPEKGYIPIRVNPGETFKGRHDGIIVPSQKPGKAYKTVDNVDAVVGADGEIHTSSNDIIGAIGQFVTGGWLDHQRRKGWAKFFEKSKEVVKPQGQ